MKSLYLTILDTAFLNLFFSTVRVIRSPNFGKFGKVISLPSELNKMESETMVRVAEINIDGNNILIPRANLEMVETE